MPITMILTGFPTRTLLLRQFVDLCFVAPGRVEGGNHNMLYFLPCQLARQMLWAGMRWTFFVRADGGD